VLTPSRLRDGAVTAVPALQQGSLWPRRPREQRSASVPHCARACLRVEQVPQVLIFLLTNSLMECRSPDLDNDPLLSLKINVSFALMFIFYKCLSIYIVAGDHYPTF